MQNPLHLQPPPARADDPAVRQAWPHVAATPLPRRYCLQALGAVWIAQATGLAMASTGASLLWAAVLERARGQKVYFNAWGGSERINAYLQWAAGELAQRYGVSLVHVKLTDTVEAVKRVRNEKAAGRLQEGSVDALWLNGENFLTMKREGLLFGPFAEQLPSYGGVDTQGKPTTQVDFSEPVEGMEAPWGMAQLSFFADRQRLPQPPRSLGDWLALARAQPGRLSYPRPPHFIGTSFLKQALLALTPEPKALYQPCTPETLARVAAPLWAWLDQWHPLLWRGGRQFPASAAAQRQMLADGELLVAITFNPNEAANEIAAGRLPASVYSWQMDAAPPGGSIGNTHFLAIPFNARAKEGAQVFINFMLSPEAQARKADIGIWGDPTVLAVERLSTADRARFQSALRPGQIERSAPTLPEPHASWVDPLEREWLRRYGQ